MHELSIAQGIVDIVRMHVSENDLSDVRSVHLKVGALSGVVAESLEFSFSAITADTPLSQARLSIDRIPFMIQCQSCGAKSESEMGIVVCASCKSPDTRVISGTELQVLHIELSDHKPEDS
jgi:hydrogenase nickel incorporation protein HypA/HybF